MDASPHHSGVPAALLAQDLSGQRFGAVRLRRRLDSGAGGPVCLGRDEELGRDVVVKLFPQARPVCFAAVAKQLSGSSCGELIPILRSGQEGGVPYLVMARVVGTSMRRLIDHNGHVPRRVLFRWAVKLARTLQLLHERGLVHGNLHPGNLLVDTDHRVHLAEPAIERLGGQAPSRWEEAWAYRAPEVTAGQPPDALSDQYSLAALLYEAATGRLPFPEGADTTRMPPLIAAHNPKVPASLDAVLRHALAHEPGRRYQSDGALCAALSGVLDDYRAARRRRQAAEADGENDSEPLPLALSPARTKQPSTAVRHWRTYWGVVLGALLLAIAGWLLMGPLAEVLGPRPSPPPPTRAAVTLSADVPEWAEEPELVIGGQCDAGSDVLVRHNGRLLDTEVEGARWRCEVMLVPGGNSLRIEAHHPDGRRANLIRHCELRSGAGD